MMINANKLKFEIEVEKEKAEKEYNELSEAQQCVLWRRYNGIDWAFSLIIQKIELLLNAEAETNGEKDCKNDGNVSVSGMFSFAQLEMAFEAGRAFEGHCDKAGKVQGLTREQWEQYLKYRSFRAWAAKENLR